MSQSGKTKIRQNLHVGLMTRFIIMKITPHIDHDCSSCCKIILKKGKKQENISLLYAFKSPEKLY